MPEKTTNQYIDTTANTCLLRLAYPCVSRRWGWPQDLSPGLSELQILRLHLAVLSLGSPLPLGADEDGWLQRFGWHPKVLYVCGLARCKRLMGHLREERQFRKEKKVALCSETLSFNQSTDGGRGNFLSLTFCCEVNKPVSCPRW